MTEGLTNLEAEAWKRKERLKSLKSGNTNRNSDDSTNLSSLPRPQFRNYKPISEDLKHAVGEAAKRGDVEMEVADSLEKAKDLPVVEEIDVTNLAPRKPDWDLKRDVAKKLELLERRTKRAIAELIRERLKAEGMTNIAETVSVGAATAPKEVDED
ncbi:coiled-coil domain-containing protein 12-like [Artemia franciscana]|uniref:Coiled-coil domain-containing protein 12 n=1 Tax=Artemia franciscana TaxID=6661 RepID=A0AA88LEJ1_ARTSF|nr:hypothetical protein QYM36_005844 [Artemia franciscana]